MSNSAIMSPANSRSIMTCNCCERVFCSSCLYKYNRNMTVEPDKREIYYLRLLIIVKEGARGRYFESKNGKNWSYSADIAKQFEKKFDEYTSARSVAMN